MSAASRTDHACRGCGKRFCSGPKALWCSERCRKAQYEGRCKDCGAPTNGNNGRARAPARCLTCSRAVSHPRWSERQLIDVILAWTREHGRPPKVPEWRQARDGHPSASTVVNRFGSWNDGIRAAGLVPRSPGAPLRGPAIGERGIEDMVMRYTSGARPSELAAVLNVSPSTVRKYLVLGGARLRTRSEAQSLRFTAERSTRRAADGA